MTQVDAEPEKQALAEDLIPILVAVNDCNTYEIWRSTFGQINGDDMMYVYGEYERVNDATLSYSLISLRKVDEFLSDERVRATDVRWFDFKIAKEHVMEGKTQLLSQEARIQINKCIVHITESGDLDVDDLEGLIEELNAAMPHLERLKQEIETILGA